jgi:hypothetical protein
LRLEIFAAFLWPDRRAIGRQRILEKQDDGRMRKVEGESWFRP